MQSVMMWCCSAAHISTCIVCARLEKCESALQVQKSYTLGQLRYTVSQMCYTFGHMCHALGCITTLGQKQLVVLLLAYQCTA